MVRDLRIVTTGRHSRLFAAISTLSFIYGGIMVIRL